MKYLFIIFIFSNSAWSQDPVVSPPALQVPETIPADTAGAPSVDPALVPIVEPPKPTGPRAGLGYKSEILDGFYEEFTYNPEDKRDPFSPYQPKVNVVQMIITSPLQKYQLEQLKIVGIIWNVADPKALILDPTGTSHVVRENAKIGNLNGYVAKIREGELVIIEEHMDIDGNKAYLTKLMPFRKN